MTGQPVAGAIAVLCLVVALGLAIGAVKVRSVRLGVAGVLFAGLLASFMGLQPSGEVLHFVREFGLILFVFTIGLQVGPGFLSSLRRQGLSQNLVAGMVVVLGTGLAGLAVWTIGIPKPAAVGLLAGGTTNTPSLAAGEQLLRERMGVTGAGAAAEAGAAYAIAYPGGIIGSIVAMVLAGVVAKRGRHTPGTKVRDPGNPSTPPVSFKNLEVINPNLVGVTIGKLPTTRGGGVVISRHLSGDQIRVPTGSERLALGDVILAVGPEDRLEELALVIGRDSAMNLREFPCDIASRRCVVTRKHMLGRTLESLDVRHRFGVTITRVSRAGCEFTPTPRLTLNYADSVLVVGPEDLLKQFASEVGDAPDTLNHPMLLPIFLGIALGVIVGSVPIVIPGLPGAVKLGLAGGPLIVAIVLANIGRIGPLIWYMPISANFMLREFGIALFLACVGLLSGEAFVRSVMSWQGLVWLGVGAVITLVPLLVGLAVARWVMRWPFATCCGLLAGSMTDPPALAFATSAAGSDAPAVAYATVYPLTMLLRVLCVQVLVLILL